MAYEDHYKYSEILMKDYLSKFEENLSSLKKTKNTTLFIFAAILLLTFGIFTKINATTYLMVSFVILLFFGSYFKFSENSPGKFKSESNIDSLLNNIIEDNFNYINSKIIVCIN
jgi:uncharacterized membrane protein